MKKILIVLGILLISNPFTYSQTHIISATYGSSYVKKHPIAGGSGTYVNLSGGPGGSAFGPSVTDNHLFIVWYSGEVWRYDLNGNNGVLWFNYNANVSGGWTGHTASSAINETHLFVGHGYNEKIVKIELDDPSNFEEFDFADIGTGSYDNTTNFIALTENYIFCGGGDNLNSTNIARCDIDGSNKIKLLDSNGAVESVAADENYVYWRDESGNVGRASHDGSYIDKTWISTLNSGHIWGLLVDENYLYAMFSYSNLYRFDLDGTNPVDLGSGYLNRGLCFATYLTDYVWDGSTDSDWNTSSNWDIDIVPDFSANITIPDVTNDPVISSGNSGSAYNITINDGAALTINSSGSLTVNNNMTINDGGSFIDNGTFTNNGSSTVEKTISDDQWHLISSPVNNASANIFYGDFLQTYTEATDTWMDIVGSSTPLNPGQGYALWPTPGKSSYSFTGTLNTGNFSTAFTYTPAGNPLHYGFNLMGNPYPSAIDWDLLNETYGAVYYFDGSAYVTWNGGGAGSQYIPPMQGFMIAPGSAGMLNLTNAHRTHEGTASFYKSTDEYYPSIVLKVGNDEYEDELFVKFNEASENGFDLQYDAWKILTDEPVVPQVYSYQGEHKFSIDTRPFCELVQLGFQAGTNGKYTFSLGSMYGIAEAVLEDTKTGNMHDLINGDYEFEFIEGDDDARFILHLSPTGVNELDADEIDVYAYGQKIYVKNFIQDVNLDVSVFNLTGQLIHNEHFGEGSLFTIELDSQTGIYFVNVSTPSGKMTKKIFID